MNLNSNIWSKLLLILQIRGAGVIVFAPVHSCVRLCVCVYVNKIAQKPLHTSSPNFTGGLIWLKTQTDDILWHLAPKLTDWWTETSVGGCWWAGASFFTALMPFCWPCWTQQIVYSCLLHIYLQSQPHPTPQSEMLTAAWPPPRLRH